MNMDSDYGSMFGPSGEGFYYQEFHAGLEREKALQQEIDRLRAENEKLVEELASGGHKFQIVAAELDGVRAENEKLRGALVHQRIRNHDYNPDACSACEDAREVLGE